MYKISISTVILIMLTVLFFGAGAFVVFWKWSHILYNGLDLAIFTQTAHLTSRGSWFSLTIHPDSYLGDHFAPILLVVAGIYKIFPSGATLLALQWITLLSGIVPVALLAYNMQSVWRRNILIGLYALSPFVFAALVFEFHVLPVAAVMGLWAVLFYERQKFLPFIILLLAAFLVREDVGLLGVGFSLLACADKRSIAWKIFPGLLGVAWVGLAVVAVQHFSPENAYKFQTYYDWIGESPKAAVINILENPLKIILHFFHINNLLFCAALLASVGFLPLYNTKTLWFGLPIVLPFLLLPSGASSIGFLTHYAVMTVPILILGSARAMQRNRFTPPGPLSRIFGNDPLASPVLIGVVVLYTVATLNPVPQSLIAYAHGHMDYADIYTEMIKNIGNDDRVAASFRGLAPLASRDNIYSIHYHARGHQQFSDAPYALPDVDTVLYDARDALFYHAQFPETSVNATTKNLRELFFQRSLAPTAVSDSVILLQSSPEPARSDIFYEKIGTMPTTNLIESAGALQLIAWSVPEKPDGVKIPPAGDTLPVSFTWKGATDEKHLMMIIDWMAGSDILDTATYPVAYGLYPPHTWSGNMTRVHYWFAYPHEATEMRIRVIGWTGHLGLSADRSAVTKTDTSHIVMEPVTLSISELRKP